MLDDKPLSLHSLLGMLWGKLTMEKREHAALLVGILAHYLSNEVDDQALAKSSEKMIRKTIEELYAPVDRPEGTDEAEPACSFCGRRPPDVRLAAGARAFICDSCVTTLSKAFARGNDKGD